MIFVCVRFGAFDFFFLGVVFREGGGTTSSSFSAWIRGGDQIFIFCVRSARSLIGKRVRKTALPCYSVCVLELGVFSLEPCED